MSGRPDPVLAILAAGIVACAIAAAFVPSTPLPAASAARWAAIADAQAAGIPVFGRTYIIDSVTSGARSGTAGQTFSAVRGGTVAIRGWAFDPTSVRAADSLLYRVDRGPWRAATYHVNRPDVATVFGLPPDAGGVGSGFEAHVSTAGLHPGRHAIELATVSAGRTPAVIPQSIALQVNAP